MRSFVITVLALIIAATGMYSLVQADVFVRKCQTPITYQVGKIDSGFNISSSTVRDLLSDAVEVWEENTDKNLFVQATSTGNLVVNFKFDERQKRTQARTKIASNLSSLADSHAGLTDTISEKRDQYQAIREKYEQSREQYEAQLANFNQRVNQWNRRSSIPKAVRSELATERQRLNRLRTSLEEVQNRLQALRADINQLAERSNTIAKNYNQAADTFAERFGGGREFSQATYSSDTITVYQFHQTDDLRLALTHELGHALGIKHVNDPEAIMYRLMEKQPLANLSLTQADQTALRKVCGQ